MRAQHVITVVCHHGGSHQDSGLTQPAPQGGDGLHVPLGPSGRMSCQKKSHGGMVHALPHLLDGLSWAHFVSAGLEARTRRKWEPGPGLQETVR